MGYANADVVVSRIHARRFSKNARPPNKIVVRIDRREGRPHVLNCLLRPFVELLGLARVSAVNDHLVVSGNDWYPTAEHGFRRFDRDEPTLAFVEDAGRVYRISPFNASENGIWQDRREVSLRFAEASSNSVSTAPRGGKRSAKAGST